MALRGKAETSQHFLGAGCSSVLQPSSFTGILEHQRPLSTTFSMERKSGNALLARQEPWQASEVVTEAVRPRMGTILKS